ncbi:MAG: hypothetical protein OXN97_08730 [Bryobacterales bacterium]|nr:hypothetical protein [Bryobacterales bacterium]MDE0629243.1 hypothetical protein [Bryobacterales bacterium]
MAVRTGGRVYLLEFKVVERLCPGTALAQLEERGYADKYRHLGSRCIWWGRSAARRTGTWRGSRRNWPE